MRVLVQRVLRASVTVEDPQAERAASEASGDGCDGSAGAGPKGRIVGSIGRGLLLLVGIRATDTDEELTWMANKCAQLRIFADDEGKMNRSLEDIGGDALVVSQFTLYGDSRKGNRPSFIDAAAPAFADATYQRFAQLLSERLKRPVPTGVFGADMKVELVNDGPVTIWIEREATRVAL